MASLLDPRGKRRPAAPIAMLAAAGTLIAGAALAAPIDLTIDPTHPTTADRVRVRAHFDADFCWVGASTDVWQNPGIVGQTIQLANGFAIPDPPLCRTPPADYEVLLPPLGEGSWSIDLAANGIESLRAFDVTAPAHELLLRGDRFRATVSWTGRDGSSHDATAVQLGDSAGAFWFFDSGNLELTLKMIDGRGYNGKLWVFLASTTDLAYTVTVVDRHLVCITTPCPNTRVYEGVAGHNQNVLDTA